MVFLHIKMGSGSGCNDLNSSTYVVTHHLKHTYNRHTVLTGGRSSTTILSLRQADNLDQTSYDTKVYRHSFEISIEPFNLHPYLGALSFERQRDIKK